MLVFRVLLAGLLAIAWADTARADRLGRVSAEQAFDAFVEQTDPYSGIRAQVLIVDIRTRAEVYWVGTSAMVDRLLLKDGREIYPDDGKVWVTYGDMLVFYLYGHQWWLYADEVSSVDTSAIAINVPYLLWDEGSAMMVPNKDFFEWIGQLHDPNGDTVLILMCRSGVRSQVAALHPQFPMHLFKAVYEIDRYDVNGRGGFEGTNYKRTYNGYRGFPDRYTCYQDYASVSWMDAGLPIKKGVKT